MTHWMADRAPSGDCLERQFTLESGTDAARTLAPLCQGPGDPQMRLSERVAERALRLPTGAASLRMELSRTRVACTAWGPGAAEALELAPALVGERDDPTPLVVHDPVVGELRRRLPGLRLTSGTPLMDTLLVAIIGQKITSLEARRSFRALLQRHGERAPGPLGLMLPPPPAKLARMPYWAFHTSGIERRRADAIRAAAAVADRLAALGRVEPPERLRRLTSLPGIGRWTAAEALRLAYGDPDAVSVGDYHLPTLVCHVLAHEENGTDERMLELLEPYRGQRARVVLLIENGGMFRARRAPRMAPRSIAAI